MGNMDEKAHQFGGFWTLKKLKALAGYLNGYTTALKNTRFKKLYIDGFAGSGYLETHRKNSRERSRQNSLFSDPSEAKSQGSQDGSACRALKTEPRFDKYIFIEQNPERCDALEKLKQEFPDLASDIKVWEGEANEVIQYLCDKLDWRSRRAVLFLDPYGMQVDWETIESVAETKAIDLWVLFPHGVAVNRLLPKSGDVKKPHLKRLNRLFGTKDWYDKLYSKQTTTDLFVGERECVVKADIETIGRYYNDRLDDIFVGVIGEPGVLRNSRNSPLYLLCFAVGNKRGKPVAMPIAQHMLRGMH